MGQVHRIRESQSYQERQKRQALEKLAIDGDFRGLTDEERATYLIGLTESLGLDPSWRPIRFVETDSGALELYILSTACYALGARHGLSIIESVHTEDENAYHCDAVISSADGRIVKRSGSVSKKGRTGQRLADARMHAETKAHRRAILAWLGIGCLDETEATDMGGARYTTTDDGALTADELAEALESGREPRVTSDQIRMYRALARDMEWSEAMLAALLERNGYTQIGECGRHLEFDAIKAALVDPALRDEIREGIDAQSAAH